MNRPETRTRRLVALGALIAFPPLVVGACGSTTTGSPSSTSSSIAKDVGSSPSSNGTGSLASALQKLSQTAASATHATFKATYSATNSTTGTTTITIAQMGTQSAFSSSSGAAYFDGTTTTFCSSGGQCEQTTGTGTDPYASLIDLFNAGTVSGEIQAYAAAQGVSITPSTETHGGLSSSCFAYSKAGQAFKFCFSDHGILTYVAAPNGTFELTSFSTNVTSADVSPPAGATIVTTPSVP